MNREYRIYENSNGSFYKVMYRKETLLSWIVRQIWLNLDNPDTPLKTKWRWVKDVGDVRTFRSVNDAEKAISQLEGDRIDSIQSNWHICKHLK